MIQQFSTPELDTFARHAITDSFKNNAPAAAVYLNLRTIYAEHIIRAARAYMRNDTQGRSAAEQDAATTQRTARALLIGLGIQTDQTARAANAAAYLIADEAFDPYQLVTGTSTEPRAIYEDAAPVDPYTLNVAPDRVIGSTRQRTAYLFSVTEYRMFCERTGHDPRPLPFLI